MTVTDQPLARCLTVVEGGRKLYLQQRVFHALITELRYPVLERLRRVGRTRWSATADLGS